MDISTKRYPTLKAWREGLEITQDQAAKLLGVTPMTYGFWERRASCPNSRRLSRIAAVTGVSVEDLVSAA
jgi:DNA-binding XRE family transcriptional regulator